MELQTNKTMTKQEAIAIKEVNGNPAMSSLRIAEVTGKRHDNVLADIKNTLEEANIDATELLGAYIYNNKGQTTKHYILPEFEFNLVVSGYSVKYRAELIKELMSYRKKTNEIIKVSKKEEMEIKQLEIGCKQAELGLIESRVSLLEKLNSMGANFDPVSFVNGDMTKKLPSDIGEVVTDVLSDIRLDTRAYSATYLLKKHNLLVRTPDWNNYLIEIGLMDTYKYKGKTFKKFVNRTNHYGYNKYASSIREMPYQVLYYEDMFMDLVQLLRNEGYID